VSRCFDFPVAVPLSVKEQIALTAERLFALHGIDGVSLRQIGAAAGNANNSAVQYHFGSKDKLIEAIFACRLPRLHQRRSLLIAMRSPDDLRSWVECQLLTVLEQSEEPGSHYLGFVAMLRQHGRRDIFECLPGELRESTRDFHERLGSLLPHIAEPLRSHRIAQANAFIVQAAAGREQANAAGRPVLPFAVEAAELTDGMTGFLRAPVSPAAREAVQSTGPASVAWPSFL
jgi:AcrR family transcriptional regulator